MTLRMNAVNSVNTATTTPAAPAAPATPAGSTDVSSGIVTNDHPIARNFLRFGGAAVGIGGAALLASKFIPQFSTFGARSNMLPLGIGAAVAGASMLGLSFLKGLQPVRVPFAASGLPSMDAAVKKARELGEDTAVYKDPESGKFALVDFAARDFDNEAVGNIDLGNRKIAWEGLVTKDGDLLKQVDGKEFQNVGRAFPATFKLADVKSAADVDKLVGQQLGTNNMHASATLGKRVGDTAGYATWADATKAAYDAAGPTAIVKAGDRYQLLEVKLPAGTTVPLIAARGTGFSPVNGVSVQDDKKVLRAGAPGYPMSFAGRSIPFSTSEPLGKTINGRAVLDLAHTDASARAAADAVIRDVHLIDDVFFGRKAGVTIVDATNPDNSHTVATYNVAGRSGGAVWDNDLGRPAGELRREDSAWRTDQDQFWYSETAATRYYTDWHRTDATLRGSAVGDRTLETTGNQVTDQGIDWGATMARRQYLRDERIAAEEAARRRAQEQQNQTSPGDGGGSTSPGDGGYTSPGDSGGSTSPGDSGGATSPGDGGSSGGTSGGDSGPGNPGFS